MDGEFLPGLDQFTEELMSEVLLDWERDWRLPFGYVFDPSDAELLEHYLVPKILNVQIPLGFIGDLDVYRFHPHQLPLNKFKNGKANQGFFFTPWEAKPSAMQKRCQMIRITPGGFWKVTEETMNLPVYSQCHKIIGFKSRLIYYEGQHNNGRITDWRMAEFCCDPAEITARVICMVCKVWREVRRDEIGDVEELVLTEGETELQINPKLGDYGLEINHEDEKKSATHVLYTSL